MNKIRWEKDNISNDENIDNIETQVVIEHHGTQD